MSRNPINSQRVQIRNSASDTKSHQKHPHYHHRPLLILSFSLPSHTLLATSSLILPDSLHRALPPLAIFLFLSHTSVRQKPPKVQKHPRCHKPSVCCHLDSFISPKSVKSNSSAARLSESHSVRLLRCLQIPTRLTGTVKSRVSKGQVPG